LHVRNEGEILISRHLKMRDPAAPCSEWLALRTLSRLCMGRQLVCNYPPVDVRSLHCLAKVAQVLDQIEGPECGFREYPPDKHFNQYNSSANVSISSSHKSWNLWSCTYVNVLKKLILTQHRFCADRGLATLHHMAEGLALPLV
jgi:hypothetical protein